MIFGAQYERIPNPRPEDWDSDCRTMAAMGLEVIRTWLYWRAVNPEPGVWDRPASARFNPFGWT